MVRVYWSEWSESFSCYKISLASLYLNEVELAVICRYDSFKYTITSMIREIEHCEPTNWSNIISHLKSLGLPIPEEYEDSES